VALLIGMQQLQRPVDTGMLGSVFEELRRTIENYAGTPARRR
jgi:hypothetical protein